MPAREPRFQGDLPRALSLLEQGVDLCQIANIAIWLPAMTTGLGCAYALAGRSGEGLRLLEQLGKQQVPTWAQPLSMTLHSEAFLLIGRVDDAHTLAGQALARHRNSQERGREAYALRLLGDIAMRRDPPGVAHAEAHYRQALALANELGMRPLQAHCHRGLRRLYVATGQREQALEHLTAATTLYREMDMRFWLEQAEAELRELA